MVKTIALKLINLYQKTLSLDHGPLAPYHAGGVCRFKPTCSEYTYDAISKYGFFKGCWMGFKRILRCHPWQKGGWDPVK